MELIKTEMRNTITSRKNIEISASNNYWMNHISSGGPCKTADMLNIGMKHPMLHYRSDSSPANITNRMPTKLSPRVVAKFAVKNKRAIKNRKLY